MGNIQMKRGNGIVPALILCVAASGAESQRTTIVHYDFKEGIGAALHDRSGNRADGRIVGAQWARTAAGPALRFDGKKDYVDLGIVPETKFQGSFSIVLWVRHDTVAGWQDYVGDYMGGVSGYAVAQDSGKLHFHNGGLTPCTLNLETLRVQPGIWYHVAAVYDHEGGTMAIYLDGIEAARQNVTGDPKPSAGKHLFLGRYQDGREAFSGLMNDVRLYGRAISEAEIMALYSGDPRAEGKERARPVRPAEAPPLEDTDVLMGMRVEEVIERPDSIRVTTTGAVVFLDNKGIVHCSQRIPVEREVARIVLPKAGLPLRVSGRSAFACTLTGTCLLLRIQGDSLLILKPQADIEVQFTGLFKSDYHAHKDGRRLFIDERGGFGLYPSAPKQTRSPAVDRPPWGVAYALGGGEELWVSVFPPRPYNWERSFESLAHEGCDRPLEKHAYPSDDLIRDTARFCKVFAVHSYIWPGGDKPPWLIPRFVPSDEARFLHMRDAVRRSGMKLVLYLSPYYYRGDDLFGELRNLLKEDRTDGFYFDGVSMDFRKSYRFVRHARRILGNDRILYIHCSTDPLGSASIYCPFIDTYADFILRGEAGRGSEDRDRFLRWICSGYNISNTVGYWCYYGSTGAEGYVHKIPVPEDIDAALRNHVRLWRTVMAWVVIGGGDVSRFDKEYYPRLESLRQKVASTQGSKP
jgi:hypothetical protein